MGLFPSANDFKAGKGVEKDAPRKTGVGRFFELGPNPDKVQYIYPR